MKLAHRNRIRRSSGNADVSELEVAESRGPTLSAPTAAEIQRRVSEIYTNPNGGSGDAVAEGLEADRELHTDKTLGALPLNRRSWAEPYLAERSRTRVGSGS